MKPDASSFTPSEWRIVEKHRTPRQVQKFLNSLSYNREKKGETLRSFREVVKHGEAHCLEAALVAAVILEQHGYPPLLLSFDSVDDLDHVIFTFKSQGLWGAVGRSRDAGLHGRKPLFQNTRQLALSYFDPYVDFTGRIKGYAVADLSDLGSYDWRFSSKNVWKVERFLIDYPHRKIKSSDSRYKKLLERYKAFRKRYPDRQATYYDNRDTWL